jgi:hypothetical protein
MTKLSPNLQHLTDELPADKRKEVEEAIVSSPYLRQIMTDAVNAGTLERIRLGKPGANEGGHYDVDQKAIVISVDTFTDPILKSRPQARLDAITSTLGHETGHALYAQEAEKMLYYTTGKITEGIRQAGPGGEFDATPLASVFLRDSRRDEAMAEMHAWNALASRIEYTTGRAPGRDDMLERIDASTNCVNEIKGVRQLAPGIHLAPDMQMSDTRLPKAGPINLEPVAQCHFDRSLANLGAGGAANYSNFYGAYLIQQLADDTRGWSNPPAIKLDMARLGLDKAQLESTGLRVGDKGFDLIDISRGSYKPLTLHSTGSGIRGTPDAEQDAPRMTQTPTTPAPLSITETTHIAHGGWQDARRGLAGMEGADWDARSPAEQDRRAAALFAGALQQDRSFTGLDRVFASEKLDPATGQPVGVIAMQGPTDVDWHRRALLKEDVLGAMSLGEASGTSQDRMQEWQKVQADDLKRSLDQAQEQGGMRRSIGPRTMPGPDTGPGSDAGGGGE